jgi:lipoate-protein ligase A
VIGHNQNALREVNLSRLRADGGHLARRLSGGGAVYHDLGNLNFTFILPKAAYDLTRQTRVILEAARLLGAPAEASGRNDILAGGRKFSGNAYYRRGKTWYHHGTLLVDSDLDALGRYLNVSPEKLAARGVASVRSRVCNLRECAPGATVEAARRAMAAAFSAVYGEKVELFDHECLQNDKIVETERRISLESYLIGENFPFSLSLERRFAWGGLELALNVHAGHVAQCRAYSDAMEESEIAALPGRLTGCAVDGAAFAKALAGWGGEDMRRDVLDMLMEL